MVKDHLHKFFYAFFLLLSSQTLASNATVEVSLGLNYFLQSQTSDSFFEPVKNQTDAGYQISAKIQKPYDHNEKHYIGTGLDIADINGQTLLGFRAVDYKWAMNDSYHLGFFIGAASLDNKAPQNGYYYGVNLTIPELYKNFAVNFEISRADGLARDRISSDAPGDQPDIFMDITTSSINLAWQFF